MDGCLECHLLLCERSTLTWLKMQRLQLVVAQMYVDRRMRLYTRRASWDPHRPAAHEHVYTIKSEMGVPHCGSTSGGYWVVSHGQNFLVQENFELTDRPCLISRWRPETGIFLAWPCKKFYHKRIFSELGACPGSNETKGNSTCKEEIQKKIQKYKNTKKIVTTEKFMRLIYNSIMWYRVISSFDSTTTRPMVSVRRELALQILKSMLHDITWSHCGSISWISGLQRFFFWPG